MMTLINVYYNHQCQVLHHLLSMFGASLKEKGKTGINPVYMLTSLSKPHVKGKPGNRTDCTTRDHIHLSLVAAAAASVNRTLTAALDGVLL